MAALKFTSEQHPAHQDELANVKAQLHSLLDMSSEMSKGIELAMTCVCGVRVARGAFDYLTERADVDGLSLTTAIGECSVASALNSATQKGVDQLEAGLKAQLLVNDVAATAAEALAALRGSLQLLAADQAPDRLVEATELQRQAADVVSTCKSWVRLTAVMAQLLQLECAHLEHRLTEHLQCEILTAETLHKARQGARVKN